MHLACDFVAFVVPVVDSGAGWYADLNVDSRVGIPSNFFIGNNPLLKFLRTFFLKK